MISSESDRIQVLISDIERATGSIFFIIAADIFRNSNYRSMEMALDLLEENLIRRKEGSSKTREIFLGLYGGALFSSSSLMKMKFLAETHNIKLIPLGNTSSLFSAFIKIGLVKGKEDIYNDLGIQYFKVPLEDQIMDFEERTRNLSFFPMSREEIDSALNGVISKSGGALLPGTKALQLYGKNNAFLSYVRSLQNTFNLQGDVLAWDYGLEMGTFNDVRYDSFGPETGDIVYHLKQLNEKLTLFNVSIDHPYIAVFGSSFIKYSIKDSGVWE